MTVVDFDRGEVLRELPDGQLLTFTDGPRRSYELLPAGPCPAGCDEGRVAGARAGTTKQCPACKGTGLPRRRTLTSVTTVLGVLAKPALIAWAEEHGARGAVEAIRRELLDPLDEAADPIRVVRDNALGADAAKQKAATRGLTVHDALQVYCEDGSWPNIGELDPEARPYLQGLARAMLALDPEPMDVEEVTCDPEHGVAGRFDLRARIQGRVSLVDLKTARGGRGFPEAHLQLAGYDCCERSLGADPAERLLVVAVGPDGSFCADDGLAGEEDWLSVLSTFETMRRVGRNLAALKRADERAAKAAAEARAAA